MGGFVYLRDPMECLNASEKDLYCLDALRKFHILSAALEANNLWGSKCTDDPLVGV